MAGYRAPKGLGTKAKKVWDDLTDGSFEFRADEIRLLEDACREIDLIERAEAELRDSPLMVKGSQGQLVASPLVQELRQHRVALKTLFAALKLPDEESGAGTASEAGRALVGHRWHENRGA